MKHPAHLALISIALAACGKDAASPPDAGPTDGGSILDRLAAAEAAGLIDHDTYLLYGMYAAEIPALLPAEFQLGDGEPMPEGTSLGVEAQARLPAMPADVQAKFAPLFARPDDPASAFAQPQAARTRSRPGSDPSTWDSIADDTHHVIYWFNAPALRPYVESQIADLQTKAVFAHYQTITGIPHCDDGEPTTSHSIGTREPYLDVYFTTTGYAKAPRGYSTQLGEVLADKSRTGLTSGCQAPYVIFPITHNLTEGNPAPPVSTPETRFLTEHEFFHVFQVSRKFDAGGNPWLAESTADWATSTLSNENGWVEFHSPFTRAPWAAATTVGPLAVATDHGTNDWYRSALFWYFVVADRGFTEAAIGQILVATADQPGIAAVGQVIAFPDLFSEFVLDVYGDDPVDLPMRVKYRGIDIPNKNLITRDELLANAHSLDLDVSDLPRTSGRYYRVALDVGVKQLVIDLDPLGGKRRVRGVRTMGDGTKKEFDWGESGQQTFCRDRADENVKEVFIAIADVDTIANDPLPASSKLHLEAKDACDPVSSSLKYDATIMIQVVAIVPSVTSGSGSGSWTESMHADLKVAFSSRLDSPQQNEFLYDVTGKNTIGVAGSASQDFKTTVQGALIESAMTSESVSASGSCSTPSAGSDPLFGESPRPKGTLYLKVPPTGPASYQLDYGMIGVPVSLAYHHHTTKGCANPMGAFSTHDEQFEGGLGYTIVMDADCDGTGSTSTNGMGNHPHAGFDYSAMVQRVFHGTFDPDSGHIIVTVTGGGADCANLPWAFPEMFQGAGASQMQTCSSSEMMKLDIQLGPLQRPPH